MNMPPHPIAPPPGEQDEIDLAALPMPLTAVQIAQIAAIIDRHRDTKPKAKDESEPGAIKHVFIARRMLHIMRSGNEAFGAQLLSNPAWEILLDLFIHRSEGKRMTIMSLCITATAPAGTVLRYLNALTEAGFVVRTPADHDRPSPTIDLSDNAFAGLKSILD